jgi:hypothetical protein
MIIKRGFFGGGTTGGSRRKEKGDGDGAECDSNTLHVYMKIA